MASTSIATRISQDFSAHYGTYWANLARLNNLLIVLNISLFFVSELVTKGYYLIFVACEVGAIYFMVVSVWYWVRTNKMGG